MAWSIVLYVLPGQILPVTPAVRPQVDGLGSSLSPDLTPTPAAVARCEAEYQTKNKRKRDLPAPGGPSPQAECPGSLG